MNPIILITGGAGFIGSHVADELLAHGYRVRAYDALVPQVHPQRQRPAYLAAEVELVRGDVRDPAALARAMHGVEAVIHLAALVGVGQSMYQIAAYTAANNLGTAVLLQQLSRRPVRRLLVASSMSVYGEGLYQRADGQPVHVAERGLDQLRARHWEPLDENGQPLRPVPTPETKPPALASVYALSKFDQEQLALIVGRAYEIPTTALRFFNVYGPRQALSNPYTGVLAIFAARLLNRRRPKVFEDGQQQRDFVSVQDVARGCRLALESPAAAGRVINLGSGQPHTIAEIARRLARIQERPELEPEILQTYRRGDIRHCFADISLARALLGYQPQLGLAEGLAGLSAWLDGQEAVDRVEQAGLELATRGLTL